jgi:hypothetical protein
LRNASEQSLAIEAAIDAACPDAELKAHVLEFKPDEQRQTSAYRSRLKLEPVSMLLDRREFMAMFKHTPFLLESAHLFSDGSPVTGREIQGNILQLVLSTGEIRQIVMPGVVLHYNGCGAVDKTVTLLWGLYLLCGPNHDLLQWVLSHVRSLTTDMGTERLIPNVPHILKAFLSRINGATMQSLQGTVNLDSRIFDRTLRISG